MPAKNVLRNFYENGVYHVYNRGVEKRNIFLDEQDYKMFLYYLFIYVYPLEKVLRRYPTLPIRLYSKNLATKVEILAFCLMPNHFHLLIKQTTASGVTKLLKQVTNAYTEYFNQKYHRVGGLMQGSFKAVEISSDDSLLHISRYIHLNPLVSGLVKDLKDYQWSSYLSYIQAKPTFCKTEVIMAHFKSAGAYQQFVDDQADYATQLERLKHLNLD